MKLDRLIAILFVLLNRDHVTAPDLAEKFEVSVRTIYRDLDTLLYAGIPIMTKQGKSGGVYIEKDFKVDKQYFSFKELSSLLIGLSGVTSVMPDSNTLAAYEKIKTLLPEKEQIPIDHIHIDLLKWKEHGDIKDKLKIMREALQHTRHVTFAYQDKKGNETVRQIEPYRLQYKEMNWYIEGYCLSRSDFRMFKLTRMREIKLAESTFEKRDFTPADTSKAGWIKPDLTYIDIHFNRRHYESICEMCGEKNIVKVDQETYAAQMPFTDDEYGYNLLLGYGRGLEVIEPEGVREGLRIRARQIADMYTKKDSAGADTQ